VTDSLTPLQKATLAIKRLRQRVDTLESAARQSIAVIGLACKLPGGENAEAFWQLLEGGGDGTCEIPADRWEVNCFYDPQPGVPGKMYTRRGGFVSDVDQFDPQFFRIAPREAVGIDPQQRLLLETVWQALEDAGLVPERLVGSDTGVFLGISTNDYGQVLSQSAQSSSNNAQAGAGNSASVASGRISYTFGFQGPCMAIDTACSSSMVAAHLAVRALRQRECTMALVAGVNLMLSPEITINFCQGRMLSPDGRCKTFDAAADGYARGEGCGVLILKRLADAQADGDRVLAVIRGSAINQDGRSSGLTAPNGRAQAAVIRKALEDAGLEPGAVSYVEAHGTGTTLGDPIEMEALAEVFAAGRPIQEPLVVGSVKTNIGHLEAAAGVSALIKVVQALRHQRIPTHRNFTTLNPHIALDGFPVEIPTVTRDWTPIHDRRIAGVSSFGFSGTNVHILLEEAPLIPSPLAGEGQGGGDERPAQLFCLSAREPEALTELASRTAACLQHSAESWPDRCHIARVGRTAFAHRLALVAENAAEASAQLTAWLAGEAPPTIALGQADRQPPGVAFLFTGQGARGGSSCRRLYEAEPRIRQTLDHCAALLGEQLERPLLEVLFDETEGLLARTDLAQPALFALEMALVELWRSWGVEPRAVLGHSVGELAAACTAGVFDLESGLRFAVERGRLMQALPEGGAMTAILTDADTVYQAVDQYGAGQVAVAAENGPAATVIAGQREAVERVTAALAAEGVDSRPLAVTRAFHSPLIEPCLDALERAAAALPHAEARIEVIANVTAEPTRRFDAAYWRRQARYPVRFADGLRTLVNLGCSLFIEIGPEPMLSLLGQRSGVPGTWLPSLRRADERTLLDSLGRLWVAGVRVDWPAVEGERRYAKATLPTYPFQHQRYWPDLTPAAKTPSPQIGGDGGDQSLPPIHPLLARRLRLPQSAEQRFETWIAVDRLPFLNDHRVYGLLVFPAAGFLEMALAAARELLPGSVQIEAVDLLAPLRMDDNGGALVQLLAVPGSDEAVTFHIFHCPEDAAPVKLVSGRLRRIAPSLPIPPTDLESLRRQWPEAPAADFYAGFQQRRLDYGPGFRGVLRLWRSAGVALAEVAAPAILTDLGAYQLHPALLDAALQVLAAALPATPEGTAWLPMRIERYRLNRPALNRFWCLARAEANGDTVQGEVILLDEQGAELARVEGLILTRVTQARLLNAARRLPKDWLYDINWPIAPLLEGLPAPDFLPAVDAQIDRLTPLAETLAQEQGLAVYAELEPALDRLSIAYVMTALLELGADFSPGQRFTANGLAEELEIADAHRRLFERLLEMLAEDGVLERDRALWQVTREILSHWPLTQPADAECAALLEQFPTCAAELGLLRRCGAQLAAVLRGEVNALALLFPVSAASNHPGAPRHLSASNHPGAPRHPSLSKEGNGEESSAGETSNHPGAPRHPSLSKEGNGEGSSAGETSNHPGAARHPSLSKEGNGEESSAGELYGESPYARVVNRLLADAVAAMAARQPAGRALRVLEVGAGTGGSTRAVLPSLIPDAAEYVFTDVSSYFTTQAAPAFAAFPFMTFRTLDVEQDPATQGFAPARYDLILAANVLHATRDLRQSLNHILSLLVPGGQLLLLESTARRRWVDLVFGLTEGWWRFTDTDLRPDHPLLDRESWLDLLPACGFAHAAALPGGELILAETPATVADSGDWLLLTDRGGVGQALADRLEAQGAHCRLIAEEDDLTLDEALASRNWRGVIYLRALDTPVPEPETGSRLEEQRRLCGSALRLAQGLIDQAEPARLWLVTQGVAQQETGLSLTIAPASLWGLGRSIALEHPELRCTRIDLDVAAAQVDALFAEIWAGSSEDQVALSSTGRRVARLRRRVAEDPLSLTLSPMNEGEGIKSVEIRSDATYLITGGLGGLGLAVADWLVTQGARTLALVGRSSPDEIARQVISRMEQAGARVWVQQVDVADGAAMEALFAELRRDWPPLAGVIHAAGVLDDAALRDQDWAHFERVMAAKIDGAWHLHRLTLTPSPSPQGRGEGKLDFFVLFASMAGILGSAGQANHAAASAWLDALAHARRAQGQPAISLDWGVWRDIGAAARRGVEWQIRRVGIDTMTPEQGLAILAWALAEQPTQVVVLPEVNWPQLLAQFPEAARPPFFADLAQPTALESTTVAESMPVVAADLPTQLRQASAAEQVKLLQTFLAARVAEVIGLSRPPKLETPLTELGFDSLMAVELKNRVKTALSVELPVRIILEGASVGQLADLLLAGLDLAVPAAAPVESLQPDLAHRYEPFPLTDIQQAYWVGRGPGMELGGIGCHLYTEIEGNDLPLDQLQDSWRRLVTRHDMLRAIVAGDGQQRILEQVPPYQIPILDLRTLPDSECEAQLTRLRKDLSHRVFDATQWPLFDIRATRIDEHRTRLHLGFDLLVLDAASIFQLREEWVRLAADPALQLPPLELSFRDIVLAEMAQRISESYHRAERYWLNRLADLPGGPELPLLRDPASLTHPHFVRRLHRLDPADWAALRTRAQRLGLTPSGLLCAAYAEVLAVWSRHARFCITLTLFNRPRLHPQVMQIIGDFTSTILLEVDGAASGFADRAKALQQRLAADLDHGAFSGVQVLREQARRQRGRVSAVPVVFTSALGLEASKPGDSAWESLGEMVYSVAQTPQVLIDHQVSEQDGGLLFTWDVVEEVFPPGLVGRMFDAYCGLLRELARDEAAWNAPIARWLPAVELADRQQANQTAAPIPDGLLHSPFVAQALAHGDREAVVDGDCRLSYAEALGYAGGVATVLQQRGVRPGELVAVVMPKGWRQVVAVLGILASGAAYLPIDPALPEERRRYLLAHGEVRIALTDPALSLDWPEGVEALIVDDLPPAPLPVCNATPDDLAYVIYTSGSTGQPKGVMMEHRAVLNTVLDINRRFGVNAEDRVLELSSLSFDLSVYDVFGVLGAGGALIFPGADAARDPQRWQSLIRAEGVTLWNTVPALMAMLCEYGQALGNRLRLVLLSGDWIPLSLPARIQALAPQARTISLGGATEAAIWSISYPIETVDPQWRSIPYGRPLENQSFQVLNDRLQPCPVWVTGELYIGGIGLARGYWRDSDQTARRFIHHPQTGERLYATGDLGRYLPGGDIEFLGREDFQVKVGGHRIELGEIEAALDRHPGVRQSVATVLGEARGERRLAAFVVPETPDVAPVDPPLPWTAMQTAGYDRARVVAQAFETADFASVRDRLERFYLDAVSSALQRLGAFREAGSIERPDELLRECGIELRYQHWLQRAVEALATDGRLEATRDGFRRTIPWPESAPTLDEVRAMDRFGFGDDDFALLEQVVTALPELLTGRQNSATIYTARETPNIYQTLFQFTLPVVGDIVAALATAHPGLRIVELGAGLGTTTRAALERLPADTADYAFTDLSRYFLEAGRRAFTAQKFVRFALLDLEKSPKDQGVAPHGFDLAIAGSVIHATRDVAESLRHIRQLLAPGGALLLVEETRFHPWYDLSMGLQQGFDRFEDRQRRRRHPLLSRQGWLEALAEAGFEQNEAFTIDGGIADALGLEVFLARAPQVAAPPTVETLIAFLRERLPAALIPTEMVLLPALPLTANGKVDRAGLEACAGQSISRAGNAPETVLEKKVAAIFAELTGAVQVSREDSFFALGGSSLAMVQLHNRLRQGLGAELEVAQLFRNPSVAEIAAMVERTAPIVAPASDGMIRLRQGSETPLFILPGVIAAPYYLNALAERFAAGPGLYSFQAPGLDGGLPLARIEDQAAYYLRAVRRTQPQGPYQIVGHSYGGYVAFEMAQQLLQAGEQVSLLVLLDTVVVRSRLEAFQLDGIALDAIVRALYALYEPHLEPLATLREHPLREQLQRVMERLREQRLIADSVLIDGVVRVFKANFKAMADYQPQRYPGPLTLVRSAGGFPEEFHDYESGESLADPALGWTAFCDQPVRVIEISGDHLQMMNPPHIDQLAATLMRLIKRL
jgi:amino acid adenylation domain-containing protein